MPPGGKLTVVAICETPPPAAHRPPLDAVQLQLLFTNIEGGESVTGAFFTAAGPAFVTTMVYVVVRPGVTVVTPSLLVIDRSVRAFMASVSVAEIVAKPATGSTSIGKVAVAELTIEPRLTGFTVATTVKVTALLAGRSTAVAIDPRPDAAHMPPVVPTQVHAAFTSAAGRASFTATPDVAAGPVLATTIVYVTSWPELTGPGSALDVFAMVSAAFGAMVSVSVAVLLV